MERWEGLNQVLSLLQLCALSARFELEWWEAEGGESIFLKLTMTEYKVDLLGVMEEAWREAKEGRSARSRDSSRALEVVGT